MGITIRKYNAFRMKLNASLKRLYIDIGLLMSPGFTDKDFIQSFRELCSVEWDDLRAFYDYYSNKDLSRPGRKFAFPSPDNYVLFHTASLRRTLRNEHAKGVVNTDDAKSSVRVKLAKRNVMRQSQLKSKDAGRREIQQDIEPEHLRAIAAEYKRNDRHKRLQIVKEMTKYGCPFSITFLYNVLSGEEDYFIKLEAFHALQKMGKVVFLPKKGKGRKTKKDMLLQYHEGYKADIGRGPSDILKDMRDGVIEPLKTYDIFLSHSSIDRELVISIAHELNDYHCHVYIDWLSDREDLARPKVNDDVPAVLVERMRASRVFVLVLTKNSVVSSWVKWEIEFFAEIGKRIVILGIGENIDEWPEFVRPYPIIRRESGGYHVISDGKRMDFDLWIDLKSEREQ